MSQTATAAAHSRHASQVIEKGVTKIDHVNNIQRCELSESLALTIGRVYLELKQTINGRIRTCSRDCST